MSFPIGPADSGAGVDHVAAIVIDHLTDSAAAADALSVVVQPVSGGDFATLSETASVQPVPLGPYPLDYTPDEFWSFQPPGEPDTSLHAPWWSVATIGGTRFGLPLLRGSNYVVPFRQGQITRPKLADSRVVTLVMWTVGIDQFSGLVSADQRRAWNTNFQNLRALFWAPSAAGSRQGWLTRRWRLTQQGGPVTVAASALAEIAGTIDPTMNGRYGASFSVDLLLADPFFYGAQQTAVVYPGGSINVVNLGDDFVGFGSARPFTIVLTGPLAYPTLNNATWGVSFTVNQVLPAGFQLTLNMSLFTCVGSDGNNYVGNIVHAGARPWMVLGPGDVSPNALTLTSTAVTDTGNAKLVWSPPYL